MFLHYPKSRPCSEAASITQIHALWEVEGHLWVWGLLKTEAGKEWGRRQRGRAWEKEKEKKRGKEERKRKKRRERGGVIQYEGKERTRGS